MSTPDFFRSRLDGMVDSRHPLVVLTGRLPWAQIEQVLAPHFVRKAAPAGAEVAQDMLGEQQVEFGGGVSSAGRPCLPIRLPDGGGDQGHQARGTGASDRGQHGAGEGCSASGGQPLAGDKRATRSSRPPRQRALP